MKAVNCKQRKNYAILKTMKEFDKIEGRKALQKILYFINLEAKIFPYQWNTYGPYSEEIKYQLDDMVLDGRISVEKVELATRGRIQYNMKLTERGQSFLDSLEATPEIDSKIKNVHTLLNGKSPREMELLASAHYIATYKNGEYFDKVYEIITDLKPNAGFKESDVDIAVNQLKPLLINS